MRHFILIAAGAAMLAPLGGCASSYNDRYADNYVSACQRDYERNRAAATAGGALLGGAAGAAISKKHDAQAAAIGAVAGGLIGNAIASKDDPCGYGFSGYPYSREYGYWDEEAGVWRRG
jgi:uncharacterized protein YcfJ